MESFFIALNAVLPFLFYLLVGALLIRTKKVTKAFLVQLNKMAFTTFFPFVLFRSIYNSKSGETLTTGYVLFAILFILAVIGVSILFVGKFTEDPKKKGVIVQAIFRGNTLLFALPLAQSVYGDASANEAAIFVAIIVPIYNVISVVLLSCYGAKEKPSVKNLLLSVLKNPLIIGTIVGFAFKLFHIVIPPSLMKPVDAFATMATPLAVIVLGGTLELSAIEHNRKYLAGPLFIRMILVPAVVLASSLVVPMTSFGRFLLMIMFMTPVASASFPMAEAMGADGELAGQFVVVSTVLSLPVIFLWILLMNTCGLLV